jgi:putative hemolysin
LLELEELPGEDENAYQTLGGFVMARLGRIPKAGDLVSEDGWRYEVMDMDGHRVDKVLVTAVPKPSAEGSAAPGSRSQEPS